MKKTKDRIYAGYIKRILDLLISIPAFIILLPLMIVLLITGTAAMKGNPLFIQPRPGKKDKNGQEKTIYLIKFRTMTNARGADGKLLPDEKRLNRYGTMLRRLSLDELPQLLNVISGSCSLIGPRPLLMSYLERYTPEQRRRHEVRPGLTGLAMSTVRNSAGWDRKFELDVEYVDHISFLMDLKIILWTIRIVLKREGINEPGNATNSEFMGILESKP